MSILSTSKISKSYAAVEIFNDISVSVPRDARIAIVGPNGAGKTTLLRLLVGLEGPTDGTVYRASGMNIGYLPQEAGLTGTRTLWAECLDALSEVREMEAELGRLELAMADSAGGDVALDRYGQLQEEFERRGGYVYETRIRTTLSGLGFAESDYNRPLTQLSGGQRTRTYLARLLLSDPDLLVLDEPTNHLDIAAVEWLEGFLRVWDGSVIVVSHDRYFLDNVVNHIWEMAHQTLETYRGNYSAYLVQRQERWELRQKLFLSEMKRMEKELDFIKKNIAAQQVSMAKGKLRRLSREVEAIELLGFEALQTNSWSEITRQVKISDHMMGVSEVERRVRALKGPNSRPPRLNLNLKSGQRSGDLVLRTRDLVIGYADEGKPLFKAPDLLLKRGECAAIIGPNGAGKTTFLKTLLQKIPPLSGDVILGASLQIGYFAQAHEDLNPERTLVEEIESVASKMLLSEIRSYLARFSFTRGEVFKKVSTLSGGERGRLALAKLSLSDANLLLLDEPTNHLDIPSQEILQEVLASYQGTIMLVSHDRYLIDALGSHIWEIEPDAFYMQAFKGTYSEYRAQQETQQTAKQESVRKEYRTKKRTATRSSTAERKRRAHLKEIEERITDLEARLSTISRSLENPPPDQEQVEKLGLEYVLVQEKLESLLGEWEELHR